MAKEALVRIGQLYAIQLIAGFSIWVNLS
jgi:hypothetical protein